MDSTAKLSINLKGTFKCSTPSIPHVAGAWAAGALRGISASLSWLRLYERSNEGILSGPAGIQLSRNAFARRSAS